MSELSIFRTAASRVFLVLSALAAISAGPACRSNATPPAAKAVSADTWAVVDGREITRDDVEKTFRRTRGATETLSAEESLALKLSLLNDMIIQDLLLAKAGQLKLEVAQTDIDAAYANAKKSMTDDAFQQELTKRSLTPADMRDGLRRELLTQKVVETEVASKVTISDKEVTDFFNANRAQFNVPEEAYHLAQIVVTPAPDAPTAAGPRDDATTPQAAAAKVQMLMERLKGGTSFQELAAGFSEDPESAARGGDLGFIPVSRLRQAPPQLRDVVLNKEPGTVSVASMGGAHTIVLVLAHEQAGQRDLSMPSVRERITESLKGQKSQLLRAAYLTVLQSDAEVENLLARRLIEAKGEAPTLMPAAPGQKP